LDVNVSGTKTEEEYFEILRDRIIWCICHNLLSNNKRAFHGVDMIKDCAGAFLDERGVAQYEFSGEHEYYKYALENVYRPLVDRGLIKEYENNNYKIPEGSKLEKICRSHLAGGKGSMSWNDVNWG
jgi:hypothetical protein